MPEEIPRVSPRKYQGLGDVIHAVAHPIAEIIDGITNHATDLANCPECEQRRQWANKAVPFHKNLDVL